MKVKEKPIWKFNVASKHLTSTKSVAEARGKEVVIDEPIPRGGTDEGPMPVEFLFVGLAGCTHVVSNKLAEANGVTFTDMKIDVAVTMDSHGTRLIKPIDVPFPKVTITLDITYEGPLEGALKVKEMLRDYCAVSKMLQESGTEVVEIWILNGETV